MKRLLLLVCATLVFAVSARAQAPVNGKFEIYGGYTFQFTNPGFAFRDDLTNTNAREMNGVHVGGTIWFGAKKRIGLAGEYSFTTRSFENSNIGNPPSNYSLKDSRAHNNLFVAGPMFRFEKGRVRPFARVLLGANRNTRRSVAVLPSVIGPPSLFPFEDIRTSFSLVGGFGVDIDLKKNGRLALRAGALDYQFISSGIPFAKDYHGLRVSTGLVVRF